MVTPLCMSMAQKEAHDDDSFSGWLRAIQHTDPPRVERCRAAAQTGTIQNAETAVLWSQTARVRATETALVRAAKAALIRAAKAARVRAQTAQAPKIS